EILLRKRPPQGKGAPKEQGEQGRKQEKGPDQPGAGAKPPPEAGKPGAQPKDQPPKQDEQGRAPEPRPGQPKDEGRRDEGSKADGQRAPERSAGQAGERGPGEEGRDGTRADGLAKQDAERLLDALRARERNMPLGPAGRKDVRRRDVEKDW
ncbi:MAG TPA: hypothetical protein VFP50_18015, partial [Anaeromyxobacteraceae bacterium]|nr:hypothetical protein [Anaeromyxobacteraceae bacterium]